MTEKELINEVDNIIQEKSFDEANKFLQQLLNLMDYHPDNKYGDSPTVYYP